MHGSTPIEKAIRVLGSPAALALAVGVTKQAVWLWRKGQRVRHDRVLPICEASEWCVTPHELRPDLYPYTTDGLPKGREAA